MKLSQFAKLTKSLANESSRLAKDKIWKELTRDTDENSLLACMKLVSGRPLGAVGDKLNIDKNVIKTIVSQYQKMHTPITPIVKPTSEQLDLRLLIGLIEEMSKTKAVGAEERKAQQLLDFLQQWTLTAEESELISKLLLVRFG